jgi:hypothetical protein
VCFELFDTLVEFGGEVSFTNVGDKANGNKGEREELSGSRYWHRNMRATNLTVSR